MTWLPIRPPTISPEMSAFLERFADANGVPALLDYLGLDGHAKTLGEIKAYIAELEAALQRSATRSWHLESVYGPRTTT